MTNSDAQKENCRNECDGPTPGQMGDVLSAHVPDGGDIETEALVWLAQQTIRQYRLAGALLEGMKMRQKQLITRANQYEELFAPYDHSYDQAIRELLQGEQFSWLDAEEPDEDLLESQAAYASETQLLKQAEEMWKEKRDAGEKAVLLAEAKVKHTTRIVSRTLKGLAQDMRARGYNLDQWLCTSKNSAEFFERALARIDERREKELNRDAF